MTATINSNVKTGIENRFNAANEACELIAKAGILLVEAFGSSEPAAVQCNKTYIMVRDLFRQVKKQIDSMKVPTPIINVPTSAPQPTVPTTPALEPVKHAPSAPVADGAKVRCKGKTDKGKACNNKTNNGIDYCWRHAAQNPSRPGTAPLPDPKKSLPMPSAAKSTTTPVDAKKAAPKPEEVKPVAAPTAAAPVVEPAPTAAVQPKTSKKIKGKHDALIGVGDKVQFMRRNKALTGTVTQVNEESFGIRVGDYVHDGVRSESVTLLGFTEAHASHESATLASAAPQTTAPVQPQETTPPVVQIPETVPTPSDTTSSSELVLIDMAKISEETMKKMLSAMMKQHGQDKLLEMLADMM